MNSGFLPEAKRSSDPFSFITGHGSEDERPKEVTVKFDRRLLGAITKSFVSPEDAWPQYRSIHDFVADACWHRLQFLSDWDADALPPDTKQEMEVYAQTSIHMGQQRRLGLFKESIQIADKLLESALDTDSFEEAAVNVLNAQRLVSFLPAQLRAEYAPTLGAYARVIETFADDHGIQDKDKIVQRAKEQVRRLALTKGKDDGRMATNRNWAEAQQPTQLELDQADIPAPD